MNNEAFLRHHGLTANPFRAEEARQDLVFDKIETVCRHPDFDKILGDLGHPSSSVVFGERGSGKTAIRLQIERILRERETTQDGGARVWMVSYDDFNEQLSSYMKTTGDGPEKALQSFALTDHMDGILLRAVPRMVDGLLRDRSDAPDFGRPSEIRRAVRRLPVDTRHQILRLQICYDRRGSSAKRTAKLRSLLRLSGGAGAVTAKVLTGLFALLSAGSAVAALVQAGDLGLDTNTALIPSAVLGLVTFYFLFRWGVHGWRVSRIGRQLAKALKVDDRPGDVFADSIRYVRRDDLNARELPLDAHESPRYAAFDALIEVLQAVGYDSMMVLVDRLDEPTVINGKVGRMKSFIWPMLNNKFLQLRATGFKLLLPLELRTEILRERENFFREARLDKQHMIERLHWSGSMLYDLCNARYRACLARDIAEREKRTIMDLFVKEVTRQELVDALDQLQQPRDAFKFMYALLQEHSANTTAEEESFHISKTELEFVRKTQVQRKDAMIRGQAPA